MNDRIVLPRERRQRPEAAHCRSRSRARTRSAITPFLSASLDRIAAGLRNRVAVRGPGSLPPSNCPAVSGLTRFGRDVRGLTRGDSGRS